uniref:Uncharacterized protein n=1 Tax=Picea sitchensis TaxID=3332 RepID=D5AAU3_PICSI|nr:unknown [Picea sitchensis]
MYQALLTVRHGVKLPSVLLEHTFSCCYYSLLIYIFPYCCNLGQQGTSFPATISLLTRFFSKLHLHI